MRNSSQNYYKKFWWYPLIEVDYCTKSDYDSVAIIKAVFTQNCWLILSQMAPKRQFCSKDGRNVECREVTLIDQTYATLSLTLWSSDLLTLSEKWIPRNTGTKRPRPTNQAILDLWNLNYINLLSAVLFLADVRVEWSDFRKTIIISTTARTIITEDPNIAKAQNLRDFLTSTPFQATTKLDQIINKYSDSMTPLDYLRIQKYHLFRGDNILYKNCPKIT